MMSPERFWAASYNLDDEGGVAPHTLDPESMPRPGPARIYYGIFRT